MKQKIKTTLLLALLLALNVFQQALAVPAFPRPIQYKQPDGSVVTLQLKGDEFVNWAVSPEGYTLLVNKAGFYEYAKTDTSGDLVLSGMRYSNVGKRTEEEKNFQQSVQKNLRYSAEQKKLLRQARSIQEKESLKSLRDKQKAAVTGTVRVPLILVGFPGKAFTKSKVDFEMLMNQPNYTAGGTIPGSVYDYFYDNSYGQLTFQVDVYGPYTLSHSIGYYDESSGGDPRIMTYEAANLAHSNGCNFSQYDINGDGIVDGIHIIFAGYGQEAGAPVGGSIWAHSWTLEGAYSLSLNGVSIRQYSCSPELRDNFGSNIAYIGVIAHELSHVFGVPDFYDTDYFWGGQALDTGEWDIMAHGSWNDDGRTPANHTAWSKNYLGWVPAVELTSEAAIVLPNPINEGAAYKINTTTPNEYFLLENRQKQGWDSYIPSGGLLIYHVDENYGGWHYNCINCDPSHRGLYVKQAGGGIDCNNTDRTSDPYPYAGNTRFTDTSVPNALSWAGKNTNAPVTRITHNTVNRTVSFRFMDNPDTYDAELTRFVSLPPITYYTGERDIKVEITNNGRTFTSATITWSVDEVEQTAYQWTGSLLYDNSQTVTLGKADLAIGTHTITATITIADDTDNTNNTISTTIKIIPPGKLPYFTEFYGSLDGWESVSMVGKIDWKWSNRQYLGDSYNEYLEIKTTTRENGYVIYNLIQNGVNFEDPIQGALVSPVFDFSDVEDAAIDLSFSHTAMAYEMPTTLKVQASTDNFKSQIVDVWSSLLGFWNPVSGTVTTDLSAFAGESNVQIRFLYTGGIAFGWAVDDIKIVTNKEPRLKTLTVSDGQLSPVFNGARLNYNVVVPNETNNITIDATSVRSLDIVTGTGVKPLEEGNNIFKIIVSNADNSDQKIYTVTVKRQVPALKVPFLEDFETGALAWTQVNEEQTNQWHIGMATAASGQYSAYISNDGGATNSYADDHSRSFLYCDVFFTPHANPDNIYELSFDWKGIGEVSYDYLKVYLIEPDMMPVGGNYLYDYDFSCYWEQQSANWQKATINLSGYTYNLHPGDVKRLVFMWANDSWDNYQPPIAIDNVSILSVDPNEAKLASLTVSTGKLSPNFSSETFNYTVNVPNEVSSITLNASPKRPVDIVSGTGAKNLDEGNNIFKITVSNPENSVERTYTVTIRRLAPALNVPFTEDFETGAPAWTQVNGTQVNQWHIGAATAASGQYSAYISNDGGVTNSYTDNYSISYLYSDVYFTPHANPDNIYELSFDWKGVGEFCCDNLYIYLTEVNNEPIAGEFLYYNQYSFEYRLYQQSIEWQKAKINLSYNSYNLHSGDVKRLVFMWINDYSVNGHPPIAIDNVSIKSVDPNEAKLLYLSVSNGELSPYFSSETFDYTVVVRNEVSNITFIASPKRTVDTVSGTGTKSLNEGDNVFEIVVSNPDKTVQNIYKVTIKRLSPMFEVPFTETFEEANRNWIFANEGQSNQWHIGTATAASGTHSAYISKDGGINNNSSSTSSISHMSCLVYFTPPGDYDYSGYYRMNFDWKGMGNVFMYLSDVDQEPIAGQWFYNGSYLGDIGGSSTWQNFTTNLWSYQGRTKRLIFTWANDYVITQRPIAIDDLSIEYIYPNDATLKNLTVNPGSLTSTFNPQQFDYTVNVGSNVDKIRIDAVPNNGYATVIGANKEYNLNAGSNTFNILVVSENGYYQNTYSVRVNRGATGIDNPTVEVLKVYPNPTQGMVYIEKNAGEQEIELYNSLGRLLEQTKESYIDLSIYPKGVYLLRIGGETVKVVKQ